MAVLIWGALVRNSRFLMNNKTELTLAELRELLIDNEVGTCHSGYQPAQRFKKSILSQAERDRRGARAKQRL